MFFQIQSGWIFGSLGWLLPVICPKISIKCLFHQALSNKRVCDLDLGKKISGHLNAYKMFFYISCHKEGISQRDQADASKENKKRKWKTQSNSNLGFYFNILKDQIMKIIVFPCPKLFKEIKNKWWKKSLINMRKETLKMMKYWR